MSLCIFIFIVLALFLICMREKFVWWHHKKTKHEQAVANFEYIKATKLSKGFPFLDKELEERIDNGEFADEAEELRRKLKSNFSFTPSDTMIKMVIMARRGKVPADLANRGFKALPSNMINKGIKYCDYRLFIVWYNDQLKRNGIDELCFLDKYSLYSVGGEYTGDIYVKAHTGCNVTLLPKDEKKALLSGYVLYWMQNAENVNVKTMCDIC